MRTIQISVILLLLAISLSPLEGKAIKKKHKHHDKGNKRSEAFILECKDHKYCINYRQYDCNQFWVKNNCMKMCKLCKSHEPKSLKLPAVLYYKDGEKRSEVPASGEKTPVQRDVVFLSHMNDAAPTKPSPTIGVPLFDYRGGIRDWHFTFPKEHPVYAHAEGATTWGDQPAAAAASSTAAQQTQAATQDQATAAAAPAVAAPAAAAPAAAAPAAAAPAASAPAAAAPAAAAPAAAAPAAAAPAVAPAAAAPAAVPAAVPAAAPAAADPATAASAAAPAAAPAAPAVAPAAVPAVPDAAPAVASAYTAPVANTSAPAAAPAAAPAVASGYAAPAANTSAPAAGPAFAATTAAPVTNTAAPAQNASVASVAPAQQYPGNVAANQTQVNPQVPAVPAVPEPAANSTAISPPVPAASPAVQPQASYNQSAPATASQQQVVGDLTTGKQQTQQTNDKDADCKECPKMKKPPVVLHPFNVYCEDKWPSCGVGYSACNDTWWQMNCPKRCGVCKPDSSETDSSQSTSDNSREENEIYPNEVESLEEPDDKIQSDLVAPSAGSKPSVAKYTLRVKPKLKDGIPQIQEIRILPPHNKKGYTKPLMILKQNITKPMIENIEIDVPKKGAHLSKRPSVEVIEGKHKEMLTVSKGQALLPDTSSQPETAQSTDSVQAANATQADQIQTNATASYAPATAPAAPAAEPASYQAPATQQASYQAPSQPAADYSQTPSTASYTNTQTAAAQVTAYGRSGVSSECSDNSLCATYPESMCTQNWLQTNCQKKCKLCS